VFRRVGFFYWPTGSGTRGDHEVRMVLSPFGEGGKPAQPPVAYDPIYGLPKSEIDAWLAHNPELRRQHEAELQRLRSGK
jgi:hypothetical protein